MINVEKLTQNELSRINLNLKKAEISVIEKMSKGDPEKGKLSRPYYVVCIKYLGRELLMFASLSELLLIGG